MNKKILFIALLMPFALSFQVKAADYGHLGIVGDATFYGWPDAKGIAMVKSPSNTKVFTYIGPLKQGNFKFHTEDNVDWNSGDWIVPTTADQLVSNTSHLITQNGSSTAGNTWKVTATEDAGIYRITINVETMAISFEKLNYYPNLYLVGSATPGGWPVENATSMTVDPGNAAIFTWTGNLVKDGADDGEFKIATNLTFNQKYEWIHPATDAQDLGLTEAQFLLNGGVDPKWHINAATEGLYTITVNLSGATPTVAIIRNGALPLNFISFSAQQEKASKQVTLNWETVNEVNTQSFEVEKNTDGASFETIASVPAKNRAGVNSYSFIDKEAVVGVAYYRLKQLDEDGKYTYSKTISVDNKKQLKLSVYPNPATDYLRLNYTVSLASEAELNIVNIKGEKVVSEKIAAGVSLSDKQIDVLSIPVGYYIITVKDGEKELYAPFIKK